ncbi:hypothetical protein ANCCAN_19961 [Ancylostoma caninum]|uniref:Uncharacterized protein n=1 Tax=Ancylostoma caninum TaxID=29170 RepID=A0A368FT65_ANCCA|nr:hypothetical protein ANCCAN_19961 [Ancylostoma caninum]
MTEVSVLRVRTVAVFALMLLVVFLVVTWYRRHYVRRSSHDERTKKNAEVREKQSAPATDL